MLTQIFELLAKLRDGISKPNARISVEEFDLVEPGDSIRFQFRWYESKLYTLTWILSRMDVEQIRGDEDILVERLIDDVNRTILKKEMENHNEY